MSKEKIEDRIKKLLKLAGSGNEHEANLAMERAAGLMAEHGISKEDISDSPFAGRPDFEKIWQLTREAFNGPLVYAISLAFGGNCVSLRNEAKYDVLGTKAVMTTIKGMYEYSLTTIDRLTQAHMKAPELPPFAGNGERKKYANRYRAGLASGMTQTLVEIKRQNQKAKTSQTEYGLVLVSNDQKVTLALKEKYPRLGSSSSRALGGAGFSNGRADGRGVGFSKQSKGRGQALLS